MLHVPDLEQKLDTLIGLAVDDRDGAPPGSGMPVTSARSVRSTSGRCGPGAAGATGCSVS